MSGAKAAASVIVAAASRSVSRLGAYRVLLMVRSPASRYLPLAAVFPGGA
jgi:hypothetical protein